MKDMRETRTEEVILTNVCVEMMISIPLFTLIWDGPMHLVVDALDKHNWRYDQSNYISTWFPFQFQNISAYMAGLTNCRFHIYRIIFTLSVASRNKIMTTTIFPNIKQSNISLLFKMCILHNKLYSNAKLACDRRSTCVVYYIGFW